MIIKKVQIIGYHSCKNTSINFDKSLSALIGLNGSGKTSILRTLLLLKEALRRFRYLRGSANTEFSKCDVLCIFEDNNLEIQLKSSIYYTYDDDSEEALLLTTKWKIEGIANARWMDIPVEALIPDNRMAMFEYNDKKVGVNALTQSWYKYKSIKDIIPNKVYELLIKVVEYIDGFTYYSATQFSDPSKCPTSIELDSENRYRRIRSTPHSIFLADLYHSYKNDRKVFSSFLSIVNQNGIGLLQDINFEELQVSSESVDINVGGKITTKKRIKLIIVPRVVIDGIVLSPNQLSEGTFKTLALIFYIISSRSSLLLIEEPEVCVHHGLLNSIIDIIKSESKKKQIILSTHSDFVLDRLNPENLILVQKNQVKGTLTKKLTLSLTKNSYAAMHDYLETSGNLGEYWKEGGLDNV